ncbi:MAG: hypothetical protein RLZ12_566, partial [Bacillota bacterium]
MRKLGLMALCGLGLCSHVLATDSPLKRKRDRESSEDRSGERYRVRRLRVVGAGSSSSMSTTLSAPSSITASLSGERGARRTPYLGFSSTSFSSSLSSTSSASSLREASRAPYVGLSSTSFSSPLSSASSSYSERERWPNEDPESLLSGSSSSLPAHPSMRISDVSSSFSS